MAISRSRTAQHSLASCTLALALSSGGPARAQAAPLEGQQAPEVTADEADGPDDEVVPPYGTRGTTELGGSAALGWTEETFNLDVSPTVGYFIVDRVELSALLRISYQSQEDDSGDRTSLKGGAFVLEPSYHLPLQDELFLLGGLGLGVGHDGDNFDFEIIPRVGINVGVGLVGVLTPALRVPIIIDADGTLVGMGFEVGYSVIL